MYRVFENMQLAEIANNSYFNKIIRKKEFGVRRNYLREYDEQKFKKRFRLSKTTFAFVLKKIEHKIKSNTERNYAMTPQEMLLLTLRFYASGNFLITVGDFCGVSVSTASRVVKKVSLAIAQLSKDFIKMPNTQEDKESSKFSFFQIAKFPKVIGCIDCTHIRVQSPDGNTAEIFRNRKGYFSFNVQAVCNSKLEFIDVVCRWPGSTHDSNIFNNSRIRARLDNNEFSDCFILGDSGYAVSSYMMTPLSSPNSAAEQLYNESQIRTRNCIERCFGVWKRRFPVLFLGIRLEMQTIMHVIMACAVLHNIAIRNKEEEPESEEELMHYEGEDNSQSYRGESEETYSGSRSSLISNYFSRL